MRLCIYVTLVSNITNTRTHVCLRYCVCDLGNQGQMTKTDLNNQSFDFDEDRQLYKLLAIELYNQQTDGCCINFSRFSAIVLVSIHNLNMMFI